MATFLYNMYNADHPFAWGGICLWMTLSAAETSTSSASIILYLRETEPDV